MKAWVVVLAILGGMCLAQAQTNPNSRTGRFIRGVNPGPTFQSFLIALDGQKGVGVGAIDGGLGLLAGVTPWFLEVPLPWASGLPGISSRLHRGGDFVDYPIVSFGKAAGGSPLFTGRNYRLGAYFGARPPGITLDYDIIIYAFAKPTGGAQQDWVDCQKIRIPAKGTPEWNDFATNGFKLKIPNSAWQNNPSGYGLETTVELLEAAGPAGMWGVGSQALSPYILTHRASGTDYFFRVEARGYVQSVEEGPWEPVVYDWLTDEPRDEILYTLDFNDQPTWRSTFIHAPHFHGEPMPEAYAGKSAEELSHTWTLVDAQFPVPGGEWLLTDNSPELRDHPLLEKLVEDLGSSPMAMANYVINEIELTDALSYDVTGGVDGESINEGGMRRGALGTYLEGQGSPREQCALLLYLLRKSGIPAGFVQAPHNGMKMLDSRMSRILRMQIKGYTGPDNTQVVPHELPVNYPWVAAYVPDEENPGQSKWVHIFPWIKDTEIKEGLDLYDFMPEGFESGDLWTRRYLEANEEILSLDEENDTPESLFPKFVEKTLRENHPGISLAHLGMNIRDRRNLYSRWADLPMPWSVEDPAALTISEDFDVTAEVFDTYDLEILSGGSSLVNLPGLRASDLHNRRLLVYFEQTGPDAHNLVVALAPYRSGASDSGDFTSAAMLGRQSKVVDVSALVGPFTLKITERRHRSLPPGFIDPGGSVASFLRISHSLENTYESKLRKGDFSSVFINSGRVTRRMLDVHSHEIWKAQRVLLADPQAAGDPEIFRGGAMMLLGGSYFERTSRFEEWLCALQKVQRVSSSEIAVACVLPERDAFGALPNHGEITLRNPSINVITKGYVAAGNGLMRPDLGAASSRDAFFISSANGSAHEHFAINQLFGFDDSVSTVKLLHNAIAENRAPVALDNWNYLTKGEENHTVGSETKKLKDWNVSMWQACLDAFGSVAPGDSIGNAYARGFVTPGNVEGAGGDYVGMGTFLFGSEFTSALIGNSLNGGFGRALAACSFDEEEFRSLRLEFSFENSFRLSFKCEGGIQVTSNDIDIAWWLFDELYSALADFHILAYHAALMQAYAVESGQPYTPGDANSFVALAAVIENKGSAGQPSYFGNLSAMVSDPVHVVTGEFHIDIVDLTLPGPMPLEIRRNYSSQNLTRNEFGYGWKLGYFPSLTVSAGEQILYAAEMDGSVIAYRQETSTLWLPRPADNPTLSNFRSGSSGGVSIFSSKIIKAPDGSYTLHSADGSTRHFVEQSFPGGGLNRTRPYLDTWTDAQGNFLNFDFETNPESSSYGKLAKITSSNGSFLLFKHDLLGRIKEAFTSDGRRVNYRYDGHGDLVEVTRPDASRVSYDYGRYSEIGKTFSNHLLVRERKPDGRILENDYDVFRRVIVQRATVGEDMVPVQNAEFGYTHSKDTDPQSPYFNTISGHTIITDAYNRETRYDYFGGQISQVTDPLNQTVTQEWYAPGDTTPGAFPRSLKQNIDRRNLITDFSYDSAGNLDLQTVTGDIMGDGVIDTAITDFEFNAQNLPTEITDPSNNRVVFIYGNPNYPRLPTKIQYFAGATLLSETLNAYTDVVAGNRQARGLLERSTVAAGTADEAVTEWTHDARGYPLTRTQLTGTSDPNVITTFRFNDRGEEIERKDAAGRKVVSAYDDMGRRIWEEYWESNNRIGWNYQYFNGNGEVEWTDGPRYGPEDFIWRNYDGAGRPSEELVWRSASNLAGDGVITPQPDQGLYSSTRLVHNLFGDLTAIISPLENAQTFDYDDIGQLTGMQRRAGGPTGAVWSSETFTREPGGKPSTHSNPIGGVTSYFYTADGKMRLQQNPDNTVLEWLYQLDGRVVREPVNHNNYYDIVYDDAARTTTKTLKTLAGSSLASEIKTFDRRGNCISETDREGHTTSKTYDGLSRLKTLTGPPAGSGFAQQSVTYVYDASGAQTTSTNALNEKTVTQTDVMGRMVSLETFDASNELVQKTACEYAPDHNSVTITQGVGDDAISETVFTDTTGAEIIRRSGEGESAISAYNANAKLVLSVDPLGRQTTIQRDPLDRPWRITRPDGSLEVLAYNAADLLTQRGMNNVLGWFAQYDVAGRRTLDLTFNTSNPPNTTNLFTYGYYSSGPQAGLLQTTNDPRPVTWTHTYDDFRRPAAITATGSIAARNQAVAYQYDLRGLLRDINQTGGDQLSSGVSRSLSPYGQILSETITLGGNAHSSLTQTWDGAGRRSGLQSGVGFQPTFQHNAVGQTTAVTVNATAYNFNYTTAGLLDTRTNPFRTQSVLNRDGAGRITSQSVTASGITPLSETGTYRADGTMDSYSANRQGGQGAWPENRDYSYDGRNRLLTETFAPEAGATSTFNYTFSADKLGVRTGASVTGGPAANWFANTSGTTTFARVTQEQLNTSTAEIPASGFAMGADHVKLSINASPITNATHPGWADSTGEWTATLNLPPGQHTLGAVAVHPSGWESEPAESAFTVTGTPETLNNFFDNAGNTTSRWWVQADRDHIITWDALGRMVRVQEFVGLQAFSTWTAAYDGVGRRLQTTFTPVGGSPFTIKSTFDPQHEFLEIGVNIAGSQHWKIFGPDLNGSYGNLNGTGGLEAVIAPSGTEGVISDAFGNAVASVQSGEVTWNPAKVGSYGTLPNAPPQLLENGASIIEASGWRTRRADSTGYTWMGARHYDQTSGRFLSADPLGHAASWSLYDFANGDPVNQFDPDGRFGKGAAGGFIMGDYYGPLNLAQGVGQFFGQVGSSFVPIYGQAADIRDLTAVYGDINANGLNWVNGSVTVLGMAAFVPVAGDAAKGLLKPLVHELDNWFKALKNTSALPSGTSIANAFEEVPVNWVGDAAKTAGSTADLAKGTTLARNLREQLAIEQAMSRPAAGQVLPIKMTDPRWPASDGWVKMQQVIKPGGEPVNVHYLQNTATGAVDDFKIVVPGPRP